MKLTRTNSNTGYWPDDLPSPSANPGTIEIHYVQCGCTIQETPADAPFAFYGDVVSWAPTHHHHHNGTSDAGTPPRSLSPAPADEARSTSSEPPVRQVVDSGFCEKATCGRSKVFNREWNRLWEEHNTEMKEALDDQVAFEAFKARIRQEAKEATDGLLGRMTKASA